ncbi:baseplate tail tube cap [Prochlorococcus phage P-SSM7]|uniref:Baseplate tail tube cap n=1 Tax=Prochlorococcus phage P-SSM7 TaxID=445688 RepID=E3SP11_9CAUD|nr:baseplate tail tube cap [Prochlorococcus phage P-SSM7]ADO99097.1 baseplate tail tube cap [Prochlorococcus phage P-SSM7]
MFQRKRIKYDDGNSNSYYGLNIPNNSVAMDKNPDRVYIAMPQNLSTQYAPTYRQVDVGVTGMAMATGMGVDTFDSAAKALQTAAKDALPEFIAGTLADASAGAAQFLGLAGNATANDIMALSKGKVFNPYTEQLFSNMQFRNHNFSFKFFARSDRESREINKIIKYLKKGALPIYGSSTNLSDEGDAGEIDDTLASTGAARFFEVPDKYDIKFIRLDPLSGQLTNVSADLHHKIHTSVCTGIDVNYTPDGQYNAIKNATLGVTNNAPLQVPAVTVNCRFTETQLVTQAQINEGY